MTLILKTFENRISPWESGLDSQDQIFESRNIMSYLIVTWLISGARIKFIVEHTTLFHEVHTLMHGFNPFSMYIVLLSFVMKQNLHFRKASAHKGAVKWLPKFPAHSAPLKQKCKTFGCRPQAKNNFPKIQQTKPFAGPFLLPKKLQLILCLNCTCKHWQLVQTAVGSSGYCITGIIFLEK